MRSLISRAGVGGCAPLKEVAAEDLCVAVERGETACVPGNRDMQVFDQLQEAEQQLVLDGNLSELAQRYTTP